MALTLNLIAFCIFAFAILLGALGVMTSKNVVHAAYWLLEMAVASAGIFYFLDSAYIAVMQLMVYGGAVGVLVIFTIMITLRSREEAIRPLDFSWGALIGAIAFFGLIAYAIFTSPSLAVQQLPAMPSLAEFGKLMFSIDGYSLPFEAASLILTVALIAAVWWTKDGDN